MKKQNSLYIYFSIILIFIFPSCNFFQTFFKQEKQDVGIGKFEEDIIFDKKLLSTENSFITEYSITADEHYLYAITDGTKENPGRIVKVQKNGKNPVVKNLFDEVLQSGYIDSHAYHLESIDCFDNQLVIKAIPSILQFEQGEFEIYCLNPVDLSIQWRWIPDENGAIDYYAIGETGISLWNDYFLIYYSDINKENGFYLVFLDRGGNQLFKRFIQGSMPVEDGNVCILDNKLLLHQKYEPLIIYDLNKLMDSTYTFNDCIDFVFEGESNLYSNIVSDGNNCYFCSWSHTNQENVESKIILYAISLSTYQTVWNYELNDFYFGIVNNILLNKGCLFLAADYGCVYCLDVKNGEVLWETKITDESHMQNLLSEGCIVKNCFVIPCSSNGYLYYFDIKTGEIKGKNYVPVFGGKRHCYVEDDELYITTGSYIIKLRLKES